MIMHANKIKTSKNLLATIQVAVGAIIISFSAVFVKLSQVGPMASGFYRMFFGALGLFIIALLTRQKLWGGAASLIVVGFGGIFFAFDIICWHLSIESVGPGMATILGNFQVFILAAIGVLFYGDRFSRKSLWAFPLVVIGMFLLVGREWLQLSSYYHIGIYFGLATAVFYGLYTLTLRQSQMLIKSLTSTTSLMYICAMAAIVSAIVTVFSHESFHIPDLANWGYMLAYGFFGQVLGWLLISKGLPNISLSLAGFLLLLQPSLSFVWDVTIFKRPTPMVEIIGALITLTAIYLTTRGQASS